MTEEKTENFLSKEDAEDKSVLSICLKLLNIFFKMFVLRLKKQKLMRQKKKQK